MAHIVVKHDDGILLYNHSDGDGSRPDFKSSGIYFTDGVRVRCLDKALEVPHGFVGFDVDREGLERCFVVEECEGQNADRRYLFGSFFSLRQVRWER